MLYPEEMISQILYGNIFKINIRSLNDLSIYTGKFEQEKSGRKLQNNDQDSEEEEFLTESDKMKFTPKLRMHESNQFHIDLNFDDPSSVSNAEILFEVLVPEVFKSSNNFKEFTKDINSKDKTSFQI